jgi:creatinine amidohydrolase
VAEVLTRHPLAILPLGSLEFDGPHNPRGPDSIVISGIAECLATRTGRLLFPAIQFRQRLARTAHFPGTASVRPEVMTLYYAGVGRNILRIGLREIFIPNGHDGKSGPGRGASAPVAD